MKLDQIQYFVVAAQTQHIGLAAKRLSISPSAISHSIKNLEESLGRSLFSKTGKNVLLTQFGRQFAARAKKILDDVEQMRTEFRSPDLPINGYFRFGAAHGIANLLLAKPLAQLQLFHPDLIFEVLSLRSAQVVEMVSKGELDAGLCFSPNPYPQIRVLKTAEVPLKVCVAPRNAILKAKRNDIIKRLSEMRTTAPKAFAGIEVCEDHPSLKKLGIRSQVGLFSDSYEITAEYIKHNNGWTFMPEILIKPLGLQELPLSQLKANASISLITPKDRMLCPVVAEHLWPKHCI